MGTKYQCKRCGNIVTIKVPNCPSCTSCDGYKTIDKGLEMASGIIVASNRDRRLEGVSQTERN